MQIFKTNDCSVKITINIIVHLKRPLNEINLVKDQQLIVLGVSHNKILI